MEENLTVRLKLQEAGATDEMLAMYQRYLDSGNRQGQKRLLCRFHGMQNKKLESNREKLAWLDYMITRIEEI